MSKNKSSIQHFKTFIKVFIGLELYLVIFTGFGWALWWMFTHYTKVFIAASIFGGIIIGLYAEYMENRKDQLSDKIVADDPNNDDLK